MVTFLRLLASGVLHRAASALNAAARAADPAPGRTPPRPPAAPHSDAQPPRGPSLRPVVQLSDGYLSDAETWQPSEYRSAPPEVVALMRIDRVIGNEYALSPTGLGRVRGLTLDALRDWHRRNPAPPARGLRTAAARSYPADRPAPADWTPEEDL